MDTNCKTCMYVGQYVLNWLNLLDHALNTLLAGDADETISARTARARNAGHKWAKRFCDFLTYSQKLVTFGKITRDHCDYALDRAISSNTREIWSWSKDQINDVPVNIVEVVEKEK